MSWHRLHHTQDNRQSGFAQSLKTSLVIKGIGLALLGLSQVAFVQSAQAERLKITINKTSSEQAVVAIVPFSGNSTLSSIISQDLSHSGKFSVDTNLPEQPHISSQINLNLWRNQNIPYVVVGRTSKTSGGTEVQYELVDTQSSNRLLGEKIIVPNGRMRDAGHLIADKIYEALTGITGDFSGQIAYVLRTTHQGQPQYLLQIADADGYDPKTILKSAKPILSPTWSPKADRIAYVSFETGRPAIYMQNLSTGNREVLTQFKGLNSSPSFSPDGRHILFTASRTGNPEIYLMDLGSKKIQQITKNSAIDTEPSFAPDGRSFVFTSDRGGSPQIYQYNLRSGQTKRLTFTGNYNARPSISKDGTQLALLHKRRGQRYQAAVMDIGSGIIRPITTTSLDESPSFSPNGQMVVYATRKGQVGLLSVMSIDGKFRMDLPSSQGEVREPAWAPKRQ